ncbi:hypothetical protein [Winogradskyella alexanderae]|uniref:DUF4268 domain-containing protein n=1 Tax=Winogradskyella alexanderae TaxID=2877123 RepID=A0ABS7XUQ5_9FLAO|nr:hypothetical protein [Winogradskyella alexanderae]MCA0133760.1 hypothetical protein [Winogradskyella alexanderae]
MTNRTENIREYELKKQELHQKVIANLCSELNIPDLRAGNLTIRDERNWRTNEICIDYSWLVNISQSFKGWCWLFSIKFNKTQFREFQNPEKLIQGLFTIDNNGEIIELYTETITDKIEDKIRDLKSYDMFDANLGITLDGVGYEYLIFAPNTEIKMTLNNPNSESWKIWENEIWTISKKLARNSGIDDLKEIIE